MSSTETTSSSYPPRNETEKFQGFMDYLLEDGEERMSIILAGISACETMKLYEENIFYEYDLTRCTNDKYDKTCVSKYLINGVCTAYTEYGSPKKNIVVFRHFESLKECNELTRLNALWSIVDGRKFTNPPINVILLYEENFPREDFSESITILSYLGLQRKTCREEFSSNNNDFNAQAFASRLKEYHVEQEPQNEGECKLEIDYTKNPKPSQFWTPTTNFFLFVMIFVVIVLIFPKNKKNKSNN